MSPSSALHQLLVGDSVLVGMLAVYRGEPALFVSDDDDLPGDVKAPFGSIFGALADEPDDTKDQQGRDRLMSVRFYADRSGSVLEIDEIAERARMVLHRAVADLPLPGVWMVSVSGPYVAATDRSLYGRQLDVQVRSFG